MFTRRPTLVHVRLLALVLFTAVTALGQEGSMKLARIEVEGLQRLSRDQVIKLSGLELGQTADLTAIDAASQRLMDSGLIKKLAYRIHTTAGQITLTFQIQEAQGGDAPVVFDNFVWAADDELFVAVRRDLPSFNGMIPNTGNLADLITRALQLYLSEHKLPGKVEYMPAGDFSGNIRAHIFSVHDITMPVCSVHFPGAKNVEEARLIKASKDLMGTDYSRSFGSAFAVSNLFSLYREVGQLRATFATPSAKLAGTAACGNGVDVIIPVDEGLIYTWAKAEWSGNEALTSQELDAALGMKPGDVANGLKFDKGLLALRKAYGRKGYIASGLLPHAEFDDATSKVAYRIEVREGPQYHMGQLIVKGFSDNLAAVVRTKWEMRPGDVYDEGFADEFFKKDFAEISRKVFEERRVAGKLPPKFETRSVPNGKNMSVDVTLEITN
jgi:outer membrane protein assembly factor BamA